MMRQTRTRLVAPLVRALHSTSAAQSHIGSLPIPLPASVTLAYPAPAINPGTPRTSPAARRTVTISGPLGSQVVPVDPAIILHPPPATSSSASSSASAAASAAASGSASTALPALGVSVHDASSRSHAALWGLTRSLLFNAVRGVSEGYTVELRLVGVGYRAAVEPIPAVFRALHASMPRAARPARPGAPPYALPPLPTDRLNIKLGYAHPVLIDIPHGIAVETPQPTKIVLRGADKQKLGLFAAMIRRWRKPEPYRGKGIFVGDETIKLKEVKKK
ncbi:54S ribosomal protein L6 mitochondrial [Cryptotrichosporon argae]